MAESGTGATLLTLPSLATLKLSYEENTPHVDFLSQLPLLSGARAQICPSPPTLCWLPFCITELSLTCGFDFAHWSALFAKLTIKTLTICRGAIDSLACFAAGPITQSLEKLTLEELLLPPSEISHLCNLRHLRTLISSIASLRP